MKIYILRHGQTEMNSSKLLQSRSDAPLNETGIRQAQETGEWLRDNGIAFDMIFSRPLKRALDTARIAAGDGIPVITDDRLLEMDYGPYEGMDLKDPLPEIRRFFSDFINEKAPEGMEPLDAVVKRIGRFLEDLAEKDLKGNILVSTHAIAMKGALEYLDPNSNGSYWNRHIRNCSCHLYYAHSRRNWHFGKVSLVNCVSGIKRNGVVCAFACRFRAFL